MSKTIHRDAASSPKTEKPRADLDVKSVPSPVLTRLIEEVRNERTESPNAYNRMHNRHNRSR